MKKCALALKSFSNMLNLHKSPLTEQQKNSIIAQYQYRHIDFA